MRLKRKLSLFLIAAVIPCAMVGSAWWTMVKAHREIAANALEPVETSDRFQTAKNIATSQEKHQDLIDLMQAAEKHENAKLPMLPHWQKK